MQEEGMREVSEAERDPLIGAGVRFEHIRRITGYLVGGLDRFNNAKRSEEHDRVKHAVMGPWGERIGDEDRNAALAAEYDRRHKSRRI